ncbi:hypothetical protein HG15A2_27590 [Adhaeretor mobilis]|uniref:Uncharacterized protein n=1 Tax=Adhaeretor mobilis TaxID=1930276 RepID=A0A517MX37_9BACT|nr:hypothetical protein HG15A2_27590 [Adhaeretor mobilis]
MLKCWAIQEKTEKGPVFLVFFNGMRLELGCQHHLKSNTSREVHERLRRILEPSITELELT